MTALVAAQRVDSPPAGQAAAKVPVCAGVEYFFSLTREDVAPGHDADGHELHALYVPAERTEPDAAHLARYTVPAAEQPAPEGGAFFRAELRGRHVFRYAGKLLLVGGLGTWRLRIDEGRRDLQPTAHRLPARVAAGGRYTVPSYANGVGAMHTGAKFADRDGVELWLSQRPAPIAAAMAQLINVHGSAVWIYTEWTG
jgi:hypothetical protein